MITAAALNPGTMDRRVALRQPSATRSGSGESTTTYATAATVWARWLPQSSREFIAAAARHSELTALFRIRHRSDIGPTWQLVCRGITYRIVGEPLEVGRREYLDVPATALNP